MKAVLFSAPWCSNCPAAKAKLDQLGVEYVVVDIDDNPEAAMEANIRGIPTIVFESGHRFTTATLNKIADHLQGLDT